MPEYVLKRLQYQGSFWTDELLANRAKLNLVGGSAFTEECLDQHQVNWFTQSTDVFFPRFKNIFVDEKDTELFAKIDAAPGKKVVVLVNQWHLEGIEHHWCHRYG